MRNAPGNYHSIATPRPESAPAVDPALDEIENQLPRLLDRWLVVAVDDGAILVLDLDGLITPEGMIECVRRVGKFPVLNRHAHRGILFRLLYAGARTEMVLCAQQEQERRARVVVEIPLMILEALAALLVARRVEGDHGREALVAHVSRAKPFARQPQSRHRAIR